MASPARLSPHHNDYVLGRPTEPRPELSRMAKVAVPGYAGHRPTYLPDKNSPPASVCGDSRSETGSSPGGSPISKVASRPIPGYSGHVPGKHADNVHGKTFGQASFEAVTNHRAPPAPEIPLTKDQLHGRVNIPGYAGHMPGKVSDGQFGRSPIKVAREGWLTEQRAKERGGGLVVLD